MSAPAAIRATFSDWRTVKTRKALQLIFEVSLEQQAEVLTILGAPMPDVEVWCGIARLVAAPQNPRARAEQVIDGSNLMDGRDPAETDVDGSRTAGAIPATGANFAASQRGKAAYLNGTPGEKARVRAALLAKDARFQKWAVPDGWGGVIVDAEAAASEFIRDRCCFGESRKLIAEDPECLERFLAMETDYEMAVGIRAEIR